LSDPHIVYGLILPSFSSEGLRGVERRLPYLRHLGITTVWLSPIFEHPPGNFGYGMTDYKKVDPEHGSLDDLKSLVQAAHRDRLRIVLDFAPNHTSDRHPFYRDIEHHGAGSAVADYYTRDSDGRYTHYFHWTDLINLNYDNQEVQEMALDAMKYWVTECDIDGYRMDAAWGIRQRTPDFWPTCLAALRKVKPGLFLLAEASALDPYYDSAGFDAAYDWTNHLGKAAWGHAFAAGGSPAADLRYHLTKSAGRGPVFRFLNNNDTGARFITGNGREVNRMATAILLTLPGVPCIYMGDEVGLEFSPYAQRGPVSWPSDPDLVQFHRRLIALRKEHELGSGPLLVVDNDRPDECLSYSQPGPDGLPIVCLFNFGPPAQVRALLASPLSGTATDLWTGRCVGVDTGEARVGLGRNEFAILRITP
jgi:cyclomaltodextrinase / maltogenic alpha-amylase / neopullulanase